MVKSFKIVLLFVFLLFSGCSLNEPIPKKNNLQTSSEIDKLKLLNEQLKSQLIKQQLSKNQKRITPKKIIKKRYIFPENKRFTLNASNVSVAKVLYLIASDASMNVLIDSDVDPNLTITLNVKDIPLEDALEIITANSKLFYNIKNNILYIKSHASRKFDISFLNAVSNFNANIGGDVLGGADSGGATGSLKSEFNIKYGDSSRALNKFDDLRNSLNALISKEGSYSINIASSTLFVDDKYQNIIKIEQLLADMKRKLSKQVLIEAKVLEVVLNDEYNMGIDWQKIATIANSPVTLAVPFATKLNSVVDTLNYGSINYNGNTFDATLQMLGKYGSIDTLSNPRIRVINGQSAIISSGTIQPYWEKEVEYISTTTGTTTTTTPVETYNRRDVLDGISMGVTPHIKDDNKIILNIIPVSTTIESEKTENGSTAPILNVKEAGTIIEVNDGDTVIIGGLLSEKSSRTDNSIPGASDIPVAGNLFKQTQQTIQKRELVIFIKINLIGGYTQAQEEHSVYIQPIKDVTVHKEKKIEKPKVKIVKPNFTIQGGIYSKHPKQDFIKKISQINDNLEVLKLQRDTQILYSLRIGNYTDIQNAQEDLIEIKKLIKDAYIRKITVK